MSAGILAIWNDCAPGLEARYEHWYRSEHLVERVSVPGFRSGRLAVRSDTTRPFWVTAFGQLTDVNFGSWTRRAGVSLNYRPAAALRFGFGGR